MPAGLAPGLVLFPTPNPPDSDGRGPRFVGGGGGPIEVRVPARLGRGFDSVTEGVRAFEGVPVRGVEVVLVAAESCFVGDLVGDLD